MTVIDPADTALLVTRALRRGSTLLAALAVGFAADRGVAAEAAAGARGVGAAAAHAIGLQQAGVVLLIGLVSVLVAHVVVGNRARRRLADRLDREWAAVERSWSQPSSGP